MSTMEQTNRHYNIASLNTATGGDKTIDEDGHSKTEIKEQSDMCSSAFVNALKNLTQNYLVGFQMVQTF